MRVITVSGKAQHGKDTFASMLKEELSALGYKVLIVHYADYLKFVCKQYFGWDGVKDDNGRTILQHVGTNLVRTKDPSFWVDTACRLLKVIGDDYDFVIIPDTRFPNEIETMRANFDTLSVRIARLDFGNGLSEEQKQHPSETALDDFMSFDNQFELPSGTEYVLAAVRYFITSQELLNEVLH